MKEQIKLPKHLQAIVDNHKTQKIWEKFQDEKKAKYTVKDTTPKGYGPEN